MVKSPPIERRIALESTCPYEPGKPIAEVQRELGLTEVVKLGSNENPAGPSPRVLDALNQTPLDLNAYPDNSSHDLRTALAGRLGVGLENIVVGAGSSELMRLIADVFIDHTTQAVMCDICFPVYANLTRLSGAEAIEVPLTADFQADLERILSVITPRTRVAFLASPNNPTGAKIPTADLHAFLARLPATVLCVLDLAYHEYVVSGDAADPAELLRRFPNVLLLRTFSKVYGLAGLRVGYAVGREDVIADLQRARMPFTCNTPALVAGRIALEDEEYVARSVALNQSMLAYLNRELSAADLKPAASEANFVLVDVGVDAEDVFQRLLRRGLIVRPMRHPRLASFVRITTGDEEQTARVAEALREVTQEARA